MKRCNACKKVLWWWQFTLPHIHWDCRDLYREQLIAELKLENPHWPNQPNIRIWEAWQRGRSAAMEKLTRGWK